MGDRMSESQPSKAAKAPWHLWLVGIVGLLWSAMGALDYVMTETRNESWMSGFTPEQLSFFYSLPTWVVAAWAVGVWGGVLGAILLLLRKDLAVWVLLASFAAAALTTFHNFVLSNGMEVMGDSVSLMFVAIINVIALAMYLYARAMEQRGVLV